MSSEYNKNHVPVELTDEESDKVAGGTAGGCAVDGGVDEAQFPIRYICKDCANYSQLEEKVIITVSDGLGALKTRYTAQCSLYGHSKFLSLI